MDIKMNIKIIFSICESLTDLYTGTKIWVKFVSHPTGPIVILVLKLDSLENKNKVNQKINEKNRRVWKNLMHILYLYMRLDQK